MDANREAAETNTITFVPQCDTVPAGDYVTLRLHLPGFSKEQLRVQHKGGARVLHISGQMPVGNKKIKRFQKDYSLSADCDTKNIKAKFEGGILYVTLLKQDVTIKEDNEEITPRTTPEEPSATKTNQEQLKAISDQPVQNEEAKSSKDKNKITESQATKKDEIEKPGSIRDDEQNARENTPAKIDADQSAEKLKMKSESPSHKLKMAREKMKFVMAVFCVIALGMFISKMQAWFFRKDDN